MAVLERFVSFTAAYIASDPTAFPITTFPAIAAGEAAMITGINVFNSVAYAANVTQIIVTGGTTTTVYSNALTGNNGANFITPAAPFILMPGEGLSYVFNNTNPGNVTFAITYRLMPSQSVTNAIKFLNARAAGATGTVTALTNATASVIFIKSLRLTTVGASAYRASIGAGIVVESNSVAATESDNLILNTDQLFLLPTQDLIISQTAASNYDWHVSYYYDPLYV